MRFRFCVKLLYGSNPLGTARFTSCTQRVGGLHNFQLFYAVLAGANALRLLAQKNV